VTFPSPTSIGQIATEGGIQYRLDVINPPVWTRITTPPVYGAVGNDEFDPTLYRVNGVGINTPPAHLAGNRYIIGASPTGAWANQAQMIAESNGSAWAFVEPVSGIHAFDVTTGYVHSYNGVSWSIGTISTTVTNTVALPDGDYGDVTVTGTNIAIKPGRVTAADLGPLNDLSPTQISNLQSQIGSGSGVGNGTQTWHDPNGFMTIAPGQTGLFPHGIALPSLPSVARLAIIIQNLGQPFPASRLALQISLDDGATWIDDVIDGSGSIGSGYQVIPFDRGDGTEQFLGMEVTPKVDQYGLTYSVVTGSEVSATDSGPMRLRLISRAGASSIKLTTVSVG